MFIRIFCASLFSLLSLIIGGVTLAYQGLEEFIDGTEEVEVPVSKVSKQENLVLSTQQKNQINSFASEKGVIFEVSCDTESVLSTFDINSLDSIGKELFRLGWKESNYEYNLDFESCSFYAHGDRSFYYKRRDNMDDPVYNTETEAIEIAKQIIKEKNLESKIPYTIGDPIVLERYNNNNNEVIVEENTNAQVQYNAYHIVFPFSIGTTKLYMHGRPIGIEIDLENGEVRGLSISLLKIKAKKAKAQQISAQDMLDFVEDELSKHPELMFMGGKVKVKEIEKVFSIERFYERENNKEHKYLVSSVALHLDDKHNNHPFFSSFVLPKFSFLLDEYNNRW